MFDRAPKAARPLAYDVGMNNGDDTQYYLRKGYRVIGIEANSALCAAATERFHTEIASGRLTILNVGVGKRKGIADFYLDTLQHTTSTFVPQPNESGRYHVTQIRIELLSSLMRQYGIANLLKIDIEGLDYAVLEDLYFNQIRPLYISAEAHTIDVFCMLVCMGYDQFKVINSARVFDDFSNHPITLLNGDTEHFRFEHNSSGPFGDDLPGPWLAKEAATSALLSLGSTWRDVHARNIKEIYLQQMKQAGRSNPEIELELAYAYWRLYPDVRQDPHYGEHGDLGFAGARRHFEDFGRFERGRKWPRRPAKT